MSWLRQSACLDALFSLDDKSILINAMTEASLNRIYQINTDSGEVERRFEGLDSPILSFDVSPDGRYLFAASQTTAALWDLQSGQELSSFLLPTPGSETRAVFPSASDSAVIVQDNTNQLIQWRINALPTLANLRIWILKNRYLRLLTCEERDLFEVQPYCGE